MTRNALIPVSEFLELTRLAPAELLAMLERGELGFERGSAGELLIDLNGVTPAQLANRSRTGGIASLPEDQAMLLKEIVATELVGALEHILEEAVELAVDWQLRSIESDPSQPLAKCPDDD